MTHCSVGSYSSRLLALPGSAKVTDGRKVTLALLVLCLRSTGIALWVTGRKQPRQNSRPHQDEQLDEQLDQTPAVRYILPIIRKPTANSMECPPATTCYWGPFLFWGRSSKKNTQSPGASLSSSVGPAISSAGAPASRVMCGVLISPSPALLLGSLSGMT